MTLREAIEIKLKYQFAKETLTTSQSGDGDVFHYFTITINGVTLHLAPEDKRPGVWFGSILELPVKFYSVGSFQSVIKAIQDGEWIEWTAQ